MIKYLKSIRFIMDANEKILLEKDRNDTRQAFRKVTKRAVFKGKLTDKQRDGIAKSLL